MPLVATRPEGSDPRIAGMAFDYRVRFGLGPTDPYRLAAAQGAQDAVAYGVLDQLVADDFFADLTSCLAASRPWERLLDDRKERTLTRFCVVLAHLESAARAGTRVLLSEDFARRFADSSSDELLEAVTSTAVADITAMTTLTTSAVAAWHRAIRFGAPYHPNPTFAGSALIGGADADMIVGDEIVEIKTSGKATSAEVRKALQQLAGYTLLDFDDSFAIRNLTVWFPRLDWLRTWPVHAVLSAPGGKPYAWTVGEPRLPEVENRLAEFRNKMRIACTDLVHFASGPTGT